MSVKLCMLLISLYGPTETITTFYFIQRRLTTLHCSFIKTRYCFFVFFISCHLEDLCRGPQFSVPTMTGYDLYQKVPFQVLQWVVRLIQQLNGCKLGTYLARTGSGKGH